MATELVTYPNFGCQSGTIVLYATSLQIYIGHVSFNGDTIDMITSNVEKKGNGTRLLRAAETHIKDNGWNYVYLTPIFSAEPFFLKNGYRRTGLLDWPALIWRMQFNTMVKKI